MEAMTKPVGAEPRRAGRPSFVHELARYWKDLPHKGLFFALLAAWVVLFQFFGNPTLGYVDTPSLFHWWVWVETRSSEEGHAWIIPIVVLGLMWWKREELRAVGKRVWLPALGLLAGALIIHIIGFLVQQTRISVLAFFFGWYALMGLVWGPGWLRATFFPFFLFVFCVPLGNSAQYITFPMRMIVTKLSVATSNGLLGIHVLRDGSQIFNAKHTFQDHVAPACSGIRSLISLIALTTIYGFMTFRANWKRWLMVALAFPLAIAGNTLRIMGVIVAGEAFGQKAGSVIEQKLGFVTFAVALGAIFLLGHWLGEKKPRSLIAGDEDGKVANQVATEPNV